MINSKFTYRSSGIEIMDDLNCSGEVVHQTLRELEIINRMLGGNAVTVQGVLSLLKEKSQIPIQVIDLGCGGGDMVLLLKRKFEKSNIKATFKGIDANPNIVAYASSHAHTEPGVSFEALDILSNDFRNQSCDVALATLFFHHFTNDQLVDILSHLKNQCRIGFVINDLHRHPFAYYSIELLTRLFSKSNMVKNDGPLSVLRGFSKKELITILARAEIKSYTIKWMWAFRWQVIVKI